jgi:hypothetical protein
MPTLTKPVPRRKTPPLTREVVVRALQSEKSNLILARELGVHKETIVSWRKKLGIPRFTPQDACREIILTVLAESAYEGSEGLSQIELMQHCHCSRQKLYWILRAMAAEGLVYAVGGTNARRWFLGAVKERTP